MSKKYSPKLDQNYKIQKELIEEKLLKEIKNSFIILIIVNAIVLIIRSCIENRVLEIVINILIGIFDIFFICGYIQKIFKGAIELEKQQEKEWFKENDVKTKSKIFRRK